MFEVADPIYMDYHATTPCDPKVVEAMLPYFSEKFGNPSSSTHQFGLEARAAVEKARKQVASIVGSGAGEVIFTSGATEALNQGILGLLRQNKSQERHIITTMIEHKAVLNTCKQLESEGVEVTYIRPERDGCVSFEKIQEAIRPSTVLIAVMAVNNEVGSIQPLREIASLTRDKDILFLVDAAQAIGKVSIDIHEMGIDLLALSGHKICGPKGVGALVIRRRTPRIEMNPCSFGGGNEKGIRSGTLNVTGIVGLGKACELCQESMDFDPGRVRALRDQLESGFKKNLDKLVIHGNPDHRVCCNLHVSFLGIRSSELMLAIPELAVSAGSACNSSTGGMSHVLSAMGIPREEAESSIRFGLGRFNTEDEVSKVIRKVTAHVKALREGWSNLDGFGTV